jgi:hypothetical protein
MNLCRLTCICVAVRDEARARCHRRPTPEGSWFWRVSWSIYLCRLRSITANQHRGIHSLFCYGFFMPLFKPHSNFEISEAKVGGLSRTRPHIHHLTLAAPSTDNDRPAFTQPQHTKS